MNILKRFSLLLSDKQVAFLMFIVKHKYMPRFIKLRTLSEKIQYIKLFNRNPLRALVVDRLKVRDYVLEKSPGCKFVNVLWSGTGFNEDFWDSLPQAFLIKAIHGSKMTMVVHKEKHSFDDVFIETSAWLQKDYSKFGREWVYQDLEKYLIVEENLKLTVKSPLTLSFLF